MAADTSFDLERFVAAQESVFETALAELKAGQKRSHWMWFVFPQLRGLGQSPTAIFYGIGSLREARAYLAHGVLGPRLQRCTETVTAIQERSIRVIFGTPDDMKFGSSMTLFARATQSQASVFHRAIDRYCDGRMDPRTLALLGEGDEGR